MGAPVIHFEIGCRDARKNAEFYKSLFDWGFESYGNANMANTGSQQGIHGHLNQLGHEPHNYCVIYVQVDDIDKYIAKAQTLGGKVCVPATEVPNMGHFAWIKDPEGNSVGLWKPLAS